MTVQAFPVRFAETVNRLGSPRAERTRVEPLVEDAASAFEHDGPPDAS